MIKTMLTHPSPEKVHSPVPVPYDVDGQRCLVAATRDYVAGRHVTSFRCIRGPLQGAAWTEEEWMRLRKMGAATEIGAGREVAI